jgi:hypothetical protein
MPLVPDLSSRAMHSVALLLLGALAGACDRASAKPSPSPSALATAEGSSTGAVAAPSSVSAPGAFVAPAASASASPGELWAPGALGLHDDPTQSSCPPTMPLGRTAPPGAGGAEPFKTRASLSLEDAVVSSGYDKQIVYRVVRAHLSRLHHCHDDPLARPPGKPDQLVLRFQITQEGTVTAIELGATPDPVARCLTQELKALHFPEPPKEAARPVSVSVSLQFERRDGA